MWNLFVSPSSTKHQTLLRYWKTWPNMKLLLSRCCGDEKPVSLSWSFLMVVWLLEQQEAWTLVSESWHGGSRAKMKLFHCHILNWVASCPLKHPSTTVQPHGLLALPKRLRLNPLQTYFCCAGRTEVADQFMCQKIKYEVCPGSKPGSKCSPELEVAAWEMKSVCWTVKTARENRMMSIQQADVLQCLSRRFDESICHILLLSERATNPLSALFTTLWYLLCLQLYVTADAFNGYLWFHLHERLIRVRVTRRSQNSLLAGFDVTHLFH